MLKKPMNSPTTDDNTLDTHNVSVAEWLIGQGEVALLINNYQLARKIFYTAALFVPQHYRCRFYLCWTNYLVAPNNIFKKHFGKKLLYIAEQLIINDSPWPKVHYVLGNYFYKIGKIQVARHHFRLAQHLEHDLRNYPVNRDG